MLTAWFIRHAESEGNAGLPTTESETTPLTPKGIVQAERLARVFTEPPTLLVVSPYCRSQQTAEPTIRRFPEAPLAVWPVQEFTYIARHAGRPMTGQERKPLVEAYWHRCDPFYRDGGIAESFAQVMERIQTVLSLLRAQGDGVVALFSHGVFMRALYWALLTGSFEASQERMQRFHHLRASFIVPNTAILKLVLMGDELWMSPLLTGHLARQATNQPESPQAPARPAD